MEILESVCDVRKIKVKQKKSMQNIRKAAEETDSSNYAIISSGLNIFHTLQCIEWTSLHSQYATMLQEMNKFS